MAYGMKRERTVAVATTVTPTVSMHIYHTHIGPVWEGSRQLRLFHCSAREAEQGEKKKSFSGRREKTGSVL